MPDKTPELRPDGLRADGRAADEIRLPEVQIGFHRVSEGSVLYRAGGTVLLATASLDAKVPSFLEGKGRGWVTAEYQMHPRANPRREGREGRGSKSVSGRTQEIQRLVGRSLRAAVDLERLGEKQLVVDCDVLEADGGTRTASVTAGFLALALALAAMQKRGQLESPVLRTAVAAISVGHVDDRLVVDLPYSEDSRARVDLNLVATSQGDIVEIQGTSEGEPIARASMDAMVDLALTGIIQLTKLQRDVLASVAVDLNDLTISR